LPAILVAMGLRFVREKVVEELRITSRASASREITFGDMPVVEVVVVVDDDDEGRGKKESSRMLVVHAPPPPPQAWSVEAVPPLSRSEIIPSRPGWTKTAPHALPLLALLATNSVA